MEHHLPLLSVAAATDQSKLPKDNSGQSPRKIVGATGWTNQTKTMGASRWVGGKLGWHCNGGQQCASAVAEPGRWLNWIATRCNNNYNDNDKGGRRPWWGGFPQGGKVHEEGQDKEEGSASAEEVRRAAVQVDGGDMAFLLMVEVTVAIATALSSTSALGASSLLGAGTMMIIPGLSSLQQCPQQWGQQQKVGLGVGGIPMTGTMSRHPSLTLVTFSLGFHHFDFQVKQGELLWLY
jgi:hypothetical protein